jgi:hypothetical protein
VSLRYIYEIGLSKRYFPGFIRGIEELLVLALSVMFTPFPLMAINYLFSSFVCYIGIAYQLPGAFSGERANLLTSHMKAMGLLDSARIMSVFALNIECHIA